MNGTEARELCPQIHLAHVQTWAEGDSEPQYHKDPTVQTHKVAPLHMPLTNRFPSTRIVEQALKSSKFSELIVIAWKKLR